MNPKGQRRYLIAIKRRDLKASKAEKRVILDKIYHMCDYNRK